MKAWDLMVNDLVYYVGDGEPKVRFVNSITELHQLYLWSDKYDASSWVLVGEKYVAPIPLTPEILLKNGFESKGEKFRHQEFDLTINPDTDDEHWVHIKFHPKNENCDYMWVTMYYIPSSRIDLCTIETKIVDCSVHQLQHALRLVGLSKIADNFVL